MKIAEFTVCRPDTGAVLPNAVVTVYEADGVTRASIYTQLGAVQGNPITASVTGAIVFGANDGTYVLKAVSADGTLTVPPITVDVYDMPAIQAACEDAAAQALQAAATAQGFIGQLASSVTAGGTLPYEVTAISGGIGTGSGGTPGTYNLAASGGPAGFKATVTIGSDGKVASYAILNPGISTSNTAPTLAFTGVTGLTGATVPTATVASIPANRVFKAPDATNTYNLAWINAAGTLTQFPTTGTQFAEYFKEQIDTLISKVTSIVTSVPKVWLAGYGVLDAAKVKVFADDLRLHSYVTREGKTMEWTGTEYAEQAKEFGVSAVYVPGMPEAASKVTAFTAGHRPAQAIGVSGRTFLPGSRGWFSPNDHPLDFDVIVYGSGLAGLMTTARAALRGKRVCVIDPYPRFGGMHAAGLMPDRATVGETSIMGGLVKGEYYRRIVEIDGGNFEYFPNPRTCERVANEMLLEYAAAAYRDVQIGSAGDIIKIGRRIIGVVTKYGVMRAKVFVDASYEGDLMAFALGKNGYRVGRDAAAETGEPEAGVLATTIFGGIGSAFASQTRTITTTNGSPTITFDPRNGKLVPYAPISGAGIPSGTTILSVTPFTGTTTSSTAVLSQNATASGTISATMTLYTGAGSPQSIADSSYLTDDPGAAIGSADRTVQAYNFRLPLTRDPANYMPLIKPDGYDFRDVALQLQILATQGQTTACRSTNGNDYGFQAFTAGNKVNWNAADYANGQFDYPDANWSKRREIIAEHAYRQQAIMWAIANDPKAREYGLGGLQDDWNDVTRPAGVASSGPLGLCQDEFPDSPYGAGWPWALYIREARRLNGIYRLTYFDQLAALSGGTPTKTDSIGKWSYTWDTHVKRSFRLAGRTDAIGFEGVPSDWAEKTTTYQIPARIMWPDTSLGIDNLIVPWCNSTTDRAWAPQRLENPQGAVGEAAGENAAWACDNPGKAVSDHPYSDLSGRLIQYGSRL